MKKSNSEFLAQIIIGILLVSFVSLKLIGYINWSWWWITSPLWGGLLLAIAFMLLDAIIISIQKIKSKFKK
jgi:hypothetical protein